MLPVAILAGGLATRLRPITNHIPKSLIEVAGKPFICHQLDYLRKQGVVKVILCTGFLGEMIQEIVGDGTDWDICVSYSTDGQRQLGTGGAIKRALPQLGNEFFVLYGDSYLPINFGDVQAAYIASPKDAMMTVLKNENKWDASNVEFDGTTVIDYGKDLINPKMQYIDYGLSILHSSVFWRYKENENFDLSLIYSNLASAKGMAGYEVFTRFYEIGSRQGIMDAEHFLLKSNLVGD